MKRTMLVIALCALASGQHLVGSEASTDGTTYITADGIWTTWHALVRPRRIPRRWWHLTLRRGCLDPLHHGRRLGVQLLLVVRAPHRHP